MANWTLAGKSVSCEVTYTDPDLFVGMTVIDDTGSSPVIVSGPTAMLNVIGNTYRGKFTPVDGHQYLIHKAVYVDGSFADFHPDYTQSSETLRADDLILLLTLDARFASVLSSISARGSEALAAIAGIPVITSVLDVDMADDPAIEISFTDSNG